MILVDYREVSEKKGSHGLWDDLKKTDIELMQGTLDGGDLFFLGKGPEGREVTVGVEFKKLSDLLSSLRSKRLQGHQLFEMQPYDYRFLLVEGEWRHDDDGFVTTRSFRRGKTPTWSRAPGSFRAAELDKTLLGLVLRAGVIVKETATRKDTVRWIQSLYRNFTDVGWNDHTSHIGVYRPESLVKLNQFRQTISSLPGIGIKTSKLVQDRFRTLRQAMTAHSQEWQEIDGIGPDTATRVMAALDAVE